MHDLYRIERYVCSRGDDVQRSIELLDKVLSEYDEHEAEGEGGGGVGVGVGSGGGGGGDGSGGGSGGGVGDCGSSTEPSIGLTPDDESPSLGIFYPFFVFFFFSPFLSILLHAIFRFISSFHLYDLRDNVDTLFIFFFFLLLSSFSFHPFSVQSFMFIESCHTIKLDDIDRKYPFN